MPFSEACERNKLPIAEVLRTRFAASRQVLEIGSGTGQHAVYFAQQLPHLTWQPSDRSEHVADLNLRIEIEGVSNLKPAVVLDVNQPAWPVIAVDAVFTANTLHIMSWHAVRALFRGVGQLFSGSGLLCVYGPFLYDGRYTSSSNEEFDRMLHERDSESGLRDIHEIEKLAMGVDLSLVADHDLPAFNRLLVFTQRRPV